MTNRLTKLDTINQSISPWNWNQLSPYPIRKMDADMSSTPRRGDFWRADRTSLPAPNPPLPFAGRIGANQQFSLDKNNCTNRDILEKYPDAAPLIPVRDSLSLKGFLQFPIWRAAAVEGVGICRPTVFTICNLTCFLTIIIRNLLVSLSNSSLSHRTCRNDDVSSLIFLP